MNDLIGEMNKNAIKLGWASESILEEDAKRMGFARGIRFTSPHNTIKIDLLESKDEFFCKLDDYGRIELHFSDATKEKRHQRLADILNEVFANGLILEMHKKGERILRFKVMVGEKSLIVSRTINGLGFFGGAKETNALKP